MLSFAFDGEGKVSIHADTAGLDLLIASLSKVRAGVIKGECEHDHLFTEAWGGTELSQKALEKDGEVAHHVKIYGWTDEWAKKHGLAV
jgi:hypothetical protein